jgi:hypothetical protein
MLPNGCTMQMIWETEDRLKRIVAGSGDDNTGKLARPALNMLDAIKKLDLDADAASRSMPELDGRHKSDDDLVGLGGGLELHYKLQGDRLADKHIVDGPQDLNVDKEEETFAGPSNYAEDAAARTASAATGAAYSDGIGLLRRASAGSESAKHFGTVESTIVASEHPTMGNDSMSKGKDKLRGYLCVRMQCRTSY